MVLSRVLTDGPGWQWIVFIDVPVGVGLAAGAVWFLAESDGERGQQFDVLGAVTITGGLLLLVFGVNKGETWGSSDPRRRVANRTIGVANVIALLLLASFFSIVFIGTLFLQERIPVFS